MRLPNQVGPMKPLPLVVECNKHAVGVPMRSWQFAMTRAERVCLRSNRMSTAVISNAPAPKPFDRTAASRCYGGLHPQQGQRGIAESGFHRVTPTQRHPNILPRGRLWEGGHFGLSLDLRSHHNGGKVIPTHGTFKKHVRWD